MTNRRSRYKGRASVRDKERLVRFMAVPLVVIILILLIAIVDRKPKETDPEGMKDTAETSLGVGSENGITPETEESWPDYSDSALKKGEVLEVQELMETYYQAKLTADVNALYQLYGKTDTEGKEALRTSMKVWTDNVGAFENITCYTKPGLEKGSYVVYTSTDIKMLRADTPGPSLVWSYVKEGTDGELVLCEPDKLTAEELAYVDKVDRSEDVRRLAAEVNGRLEAALTSDSELAYFYGLLKEGSPTFEPPTEAAESSAFDPDSAAAVSEGMESTGADEGTAETTEQPAEASGEVEIPESAS